MGARGRDKSRDKEKLLRKKAYQQTKKAAWREQHGVEKEPCALVQSAFKAVRTHKRPHRSHPLQATVLALKGARKSELKHGEALFLAAAEAGLHGAEWEAPLRSVLNWRRRWRRSPADWKRPRNVASSHLLFGMLLRWLFADYPVPRCLEEPFLWRAEEASSKGVLDVHQRWFIDVAQGLNLRACTGLPFMMTKKMAHAVMHCPSELNLYQALRWGQVVGLGVQEHLARVIVASAACRRFDSAGEKFWSEAFLMISQDSFLSAHCLGDILNYLLSRRFGLPHGQVPVAGFSIKKSTLPALVRRSQRWAAERRRIEPLALTWVSNGLSRRLSDRCFVELLASAQLELEGDEMGHCIHSYARSCAAGHAAVLSYKPLGGDVASRLTLHVDLRNRNLVEVRGLRNRLPTSEEWSKLGEWARLVKVKVLDCR